MEKKRNTGTRPKKPEDKKDSLKVLVENKNYQNSAIQKLLDSIEPVKKDNSST